jgi:glycosyltransferase involved in cell wall biosynthesis
MTARVSVVTAVKDDAAGLRRTLESVARQSHPQLEHVVVDGASCDGTLELLRESGHRDLRWISERDAGLYEAMDKGRKQASGEWLFFLNAGDIFADSASLERILVPVPDSDLAVFGNVWLCRGERRWRVPPVGAEKHIGRTGYLPHHQTILYPRRYFAAEGFDLRFTVIGDADYTRRCLSICRAEYRAVDLVISQLGGYTFRVYGSWAGLRRIWRERILFARKGGTSLANPALAKSLVAALTKYLLIRFVGVDAAVAAMQRKAARSPRARSETDR